MYDRIAPTLALVLAVAGLCMGTASAVTTIITSSKQIKNGVVTTQDIKNSTLRSPDLRTGAVASPDLATEAVQSTDIASGGVQVQDAGFPESDQVTEQPGPTAVGEAEVEGDYVLVDPVPPQPKGSGETDLEVTWNGSAQAGFSPCMFQLRVNGQPPEAGAAEYYVANGSAESVTRSAVFSGLPAGPVEVQVWARSVSGSPTTCTVGPAFMGVGQTFTQVELVS